METVSKQFRKRNAILACLRQTTAHPSAEGLYESLRAEHPDISLATVYRNLTLFKQQGLIVSLGTVNGIERFDGRLDPHIHFACRCCGRVEDVPGEIPSILSADAQSALHCSVDGAQLMLSGLCADCLRKTQS